jgi:hypothetical protein
LTEEDEHHWKVLHIPISNDQAEFDTQIIALTKILVDSLNDEEISKQVSQPFPPDTKSIGKLDKYLELQNYPERVRDGAFLRRLQTIRSISAAHRKGSDYSKRMKGQGVDLSQLSTTFREILEQAIEMLQGLRTHFLAESE